MSNKPRQSGPFISHPPYREYGSYPGRVIPSNELSVRTTMTYATDQAEFMRAGGQTVVGFNVHQAARYVRHIAEEASETAEAFEQGRHVHVIDGAVDTIVVALGLLLSYGINPDDAWQVVHAANMRKFVDGKPYTRPDGQIGKPPGWVGPEKELAGLLEPWLRGE